jgi:hypothetical protein
MLLALALLLALGCGCASLETTAYRTVGAVSVTVDGAMNGWGAWVRAGKATPEDEAVVRKVYERYQGAMGRLHVAVRAYQVGRDKVALGKALEEASVAGTAVGRVVRHVTGEVK